MSGFEVAGIVLGAFPIAIEGVKYYKEVKRCWKNWKDVRRDYQECLNDLELQQTIFNFNIRHLLLPLVAEPQRVEALIANPKGEEWANPDLDLALHHRLHDAYGSYMKAIRSMQDLIVNAEKYLGIESPELQARFNPLNVSHIANMEFITCLQCL